jgi:hypothetical protein
MKVTKSMLKCTHEKKDRSEVNKNLSLCFNCSSVILRSENGKEISTIKPLKYFIRQETAIPLFLLNNDNPYKFINKHDYLKIRIDIVKELKKICTNFNLSKKTYYVSLDYLDKICSKMSAFDMEDLLQIVKFCIVLAVKFQESQIKGIEIKKNLGLCSSNNYSKDELYLLQLLDYNLYVNTSFDIMMDIMQTGFLFSCEKFSLKKMNLIYKKMENMLYFFSGTKFYIDMTHKEIAMSIIGFIRETLGLAPYDKIMKSVVMNECMDIQSYSLCLQKVKKFFKIKDDENQNNNHSDSNTDANSDSGSDCNSENSS